MTSRVPLGELLVNAGLLTAAQLEDVLRVQHERGGRLGALLIAQGLLNETHVTQILSRQLSVPWVSLAHIDFSATLIELIPAQLARQHRLIPICIRSIRKLGEVLYLATEDPSVDEGLRAVSDACRVRVRPMIATPADIQYALMRYYGEQPQYVEDSETTEALREKDTVRLNPDGTPKDVGNSVKPAAAGAQRESAAGTRKRKAPPKKPSAVQNEDTSKSRLLVQLPDGRQWQLGGQAPHAAAGQAQAELYAVDWQGVCSALLERLKQDNVIASWRVTHDG